MLVRIIVPGSYHGASEKVDVSVSSVVVGRVDGARDAGEALGDETRVTLAASVFRKHLIVHAVVPPVLRSYRTKKRQHRHAGEKKNPIVHFEIVYL